MGAFLAMAINDQVLFENHCKKHLSNFSKKWGEATSKYNQVLSDSIAKGISKATSKNMAFRAGNLVMLAALKDIGMQEWRPQKKGDNGVKKSTARASGAKVDSGVVNKSPLPKGMKGIQLDW